MPLSVQAFIHIPVELYNEFVNVINCTICYHLFEDRILRSLNIHFNYNVIPSAEVLPDPMAEIDTVNNNGHGIIYLGCVFNVAQ